MKSEIIIFLLGIISVLGGTLYLKFRRGSFGSHQVEEVDPTFTPEVELSEEEKKEVIETTFEVIETEREQDEEFENTVTKIKTEVNDLNNDEFADYINNFFGVSPEDHPIVTTDDQSKFDWERTSSSE